MICTPLPLHIDNREVLTSDVTYDDLVKLYHEYIKDHNKVPTMRECVYENNLPQGRIIKRILEENNITYKDFLLQFGKVSKVRTTNPKDYQKYLNRFIEVCQKEGRTLRRTDLTNNHYGLPASTWFVNNCPDRTVKTYKDFIKFCGLEQNKHIWTKDEVVSTLKEYESRVNRPIVRYDFSSDKIGFSMIVINRLYGSLSRAKKEIGLLKTLPTQPLSFEFYKSALEEIVLDYISKTNKKYISWKDIESGKYGSHKIEHKTYMRSFEREKVDIHSFIHSLGCTMNPSSFSYTYTFEDGERVCSNMEYEVSTYLRGIGLKYNTDYFRSVRYRTFSNEKSRMDCDYKIITPNGILYIEVAGIIHNMYNDWKIHTYPSKIENEYRDKMMLKEKIFEENNLDYIILFADDMSDDKYKSIILNALSSIDNSKTTKQTA